MEEGRAFQLPGMAFIDTPGGYPGYGCRRARPVRSNRLYPGKNVTTETPIISTVIGEGGSGVPLAIGVCDELLMLQYGTYSVISPEGCASILWKSAERAPDAAKAMGINSQRLHELGLVDRVVPEPLGGAHRNPTDMAASLKVQLQASLERLAQMDTDALVERRYKRLMSYGIGSV